MEVLHIPPFGSFQIIGLRTCVTICVKKLFNVEPESVALWFAVMLGVVLVLCVVCVMAFVDTLGALVGLLLPMGLGSTLVTTAADVVAGNNCLATGDLAIVTANLLTEERCFVDDTGDDDEFWRGVTLVILLFAPFCGATTIPPHPIGAISGLVPLCAVFVATALGPPMRGGRRFVL